MANNSGKLTMLQNNFVMAYTAFGMSTYANGMLSIIAAGSKAKTNRALTVVASKMLTDIDVKAKIEAIEATRQAQLAVQTGYSIEKAQIEYEEDRQLARTLNQPAAAVSAVTGKARLYGFDKDAGVKDTVTVVNIVNYAGSGGVSPPPKAVESEVTDE